MSDDESPPARMARFCEEPFRLFFPVGVALGAFGVSHWIWYAAGLSATYSGRFHGLVQIQGFEMAFATGFLMTALPRIIESRGTRPWELALGLILCLGGIAAVTLGAWHPGQVLFLLLTVHLWVFALRRLPGRGDNPPPEFVFLGLGLLSASVGGFLMAHPLAGFPLLGERLVFEGVFLGFVLGAGSYLGPRLLYGDRSDSPTTGPAARRQALACTAFGLLIAVSFPISSAWSERWGYMLRGVVTLAYLFWALGLYRRPVPIQLHVRLLWISFWCVPLGLLFAALFPGYRTTLLHLTYAGGFGLMTLIIATRVVVAHCGFDDFWDRGSVAVYGVVVAASLGVVIRVWAPFWPILYWGTLALAAGFWLLASLIWAAVFVPKLSPRHVSPD